MIDYTLVVQQLRTQIPNVLGTVAGAASIDALDLGANPALPAAYVVPLNFTAEHNSLRAGSLKQDCVETFGVVVVQKSGDLRGQTGANTIPAIRKALMAALLNWQVDPDYAPQGIFYDEDSQLHFDSGRVFWLFKFSLAIQITHLDGYKPPTTPLRDVKVSTPTIAELMDIANLDAPN